MENKLKQIAVTQAPSRADSMKFEGWQGKLSGVDFESRGKEHEDFKALQEPSGQEINVPQP